MSDLVDRLREQQTETRLAIFKQAADRIEALERELAEAKAELADVQEDLDIEQKMIADKSILVNTRRNALVEGYNAAIEEAAIEAECPADYEDEAEILVRQRVAAAIRALAKEPTHG